jgi:hypothetical protein
MLSDILFAVFLVALIVIVSVLLADHDNLEDFFDQF